MNRIRNLFRKEPSPKGGQKVCPLCQAIVQEGDAYCRRCGTKRDAPVRIEPEDACLKPDVPFFELDFACIYGPMPEMRRHSCRRCGHSWETEMMTGDQARCPRCGCDPGQEDSPGFLERRDRGERIPITNSYFRIGRQPGEADHVISDDPAVSRVHAAILAKDGEYFVMDLNSTNHTYLNQQMLPARQEVLLDSGDLLRFGRTQYVFQK